MIRHIVLFAACCASLPALADAPRDYSHAIDLAVSGKNAVVQLRLPPAAYLHAQSQSLDDLRVFDAAGKPLPFALMPPAARSQVSVLELPAAIFPVHAPPAAAGHPNVEIRTSSDGSVTAITTRSGAAAQAKDAISALVLDLGRDAAKPAVDALVFTLPPGTANYQAEVQLEVSDDLRGWDTLGYASLSWLTNAEQQSITSNRLEFSPRPFRYARLTWREGTPLRFAAISAQAPRAETVAATLDTIVVAPKSGRFAHDLVYDVPVAIPAERLSVALGAGNVMMPAQLGHYVQLPARRGKEAARWDFAPVLQTNFYQIEQDGRQRRATDVTVGGVHAAQWVLRPQTAPTQAPNLSIGWRPATLVFMASGPAPYTLTFGRARSQPARRSISEVAPGFTSAELGRLEQAVAGPVRLQSRAAAPAAVLQAAQEAAFTRKLVLWGALLLGVAVLGAMAWKLAAQMKEADAPPRA